MKIDLFGGVLPMVEVCAHKKNTLYSQIPFPVNMPFKYKRKTDRIFDKEVFKKAFNDHTNGLSVRETTLKYNTPSGQK